MSYNFLLIGGDMRIFLLAKKIANDENNVKIMGFEKIPISEIVNNNINVIQTIEEAEENDIIISSIPLSIDGENIYAPYSDKQIKLEILKGKKIIAGKIPEKLSGYDLLKNESLTILNTIATAEGAIAKSIEETDFNLASSNILVLGFGRVGKMLAYKLKQMGANVYVEARKQEDLAWIESYGYNAVDLKNVNKKLCKVDIIFNTIPKLILDKSRLILIKKETLIIDLASKPGGVDFKSAEKLGIKAILYGGIPGKISPGTTANYIKKYVYDLIKDEKYIENIRHDNSTQ